MDFVPTKSLGFVLAFLLITSFTVLGQNDAGIVASELAPHSSVSSPPVEAPKPHKGGHHHHHKHHSQPPAAPPSHASPPPVTPPTPPAHSPKKPPSPPVKPQTPPAHSPSKPPSPPVKPPSPPLKPPTPPAHSPSVKPPSPPVKPPTPPAHSPPVKPPTPPVKPPTPPAHSPSKPPSPPVKPPSPPVKPPSPPVKPPYPPPVRKFVGVRGVVYCKACKYRGVETLLGASPLQGAVVKLACNNTKYHLTSLGTTDKNGFFFIQPKWLTTAGYHKCKVFLAKSPKEECSVPTNFHNGQTGAMLIPAPPSPMTSPKPEPEVKLFNVGPFAFEPSKNLPCKTV